MGADPVMAVWGRDMATSGDFLVAKDGSCLDRRQGASATRKEAIWSLKRRISDVIYRAMLADAQAHESHQLTAA